MDILINKSTIAIVKKTVLKNLPDFIVITGENGTGKSQFLTYLYLQVPDVLRNEDEMMMEDVRNMYPESGEYIYSDEGSTYLPNVQILHSGRELNNISLRTAQTPRVYIGNQLNVAHLITTGRKFVHKYIFYSMLKKGLSKANEESLKNVSNLNQKFLEETNYNFSDNRNGNVPNIFTSDDKNLIERILENHEQIDYNLIQYYYITYLPIPNSNVFSSNIGFLFIQHWARKKIGLDVKESPLEVFNQIANEAKFRYILQEPEIREDDSNINIKMLDKDTGNLVNIDDLSSGEKVILSLVLAIYTSNTDAQFPEIILFDEPDAFLHPSLSKFMLDVMQNVFVKDKGIKIIMSTHSPSTVALAPESSLYLMDRNLGYITKTSQKEAVDLLSDGFLTFDEGIETYNLLKRSSKNTIVCVEGKTDILHINAAMAKLNRNLDIDLINLHDAGSLASFIKSIPASILGDKKIVGLFDNDVEGRSNFDKIKGESEGNYKILTSEQSNGQVFICCLPVADPQLDKYCPIEYLYNKSTLEQYNMLSLRNFKEFKAVFKSDESNPEEDTMLNTEYSDRESLRVYKVNDSGKHKFSLEANHFDQEEFMGFNKLLDLLEAICAR